jgi:hypothetical protein
VTKDVEPFTVVAGNPAKIIKRLWIWSNSLNIHSWSVENPENSRNKICDNNGDFYGMLNECLSLKLDIQSSNVPILAQGESYECCRKNLR